MIYLLGLFWLSVILIIYGFIGYVGLLLVSEKIWKLFPDRLNNSKEQEFDLPYITLLISVYNEEDVIEEKIRNSLSLDYPKDLLEIVVVSDGSDDSTDERVKSFLDRGVRFLRQEKRAGKTAALNYAVPLCNGKLIVFSDANSIYEASAIRRLSKHFSRPEVGFVTGRTKYISRSGNKVVETTGLYTKLEILIKKTESHFTSCVGADGAIFAIRKKLYKSLSDHDINDLVIPFNIIKQGYRGIIDTDVFCFEETAKDLYGEFQRQIRITCRTLRAIFNNKSLLNPLRYPFFSFALFSHKIVKLLLPFCLIGAFSVNLILAKEGIFFKTSIAIQILFYFLCGIGYLKQKKEGEKITSLIFTFVAMGVAMLLGWYKYITGEKYTVWQSDRP